SDLAPDLGPRQPETGGASPPPTCPPSRAAPPWSVWGHNLHPIPASRVGQALVISDQRGKVSSEGTSGGEMDRMQGTQLRRPEDARFIAEGPVRRNVADTVQQRAHQEHPLWRESCTYRSAQRLGSEEHRRDPAG